MIIDYVIIHTGTVLGDLTFKPSLDHATVTDYFATVYAGGTTTPAITTVHFGKPPIFNSVITVNIASVLNALPAGNYDVTITAVSPGGSTESAVSNVFTVPLS